MGSTFTERAHALADQIDVLLATSAVEGEANVEFEAIKLLMLRRGYIGMVYLDSAELPDLFDDPEYPPGLPAAIAREEQIDELTWATYGKIASEQPADWWHDEVQYIGENVSWSDDVSYWLGEQRVRLLAAGVRKLRDERAVS